MSNVWETRCRLLLERLEALADQLGKEEPEIAPMVLEEYAYGTRRVYFPVARGCGHVAAAAPSQQAGPVQILRMDNADSGIVA